MVEKTDIRIQVTRKILQESLLALMKEKSILNITIKEICEAAGLSRSTFYSYYNNQYDLLREIEEQTFVETDKIIQPYLKMMPKSRNSAVINLLHDILQNIAENSNSIQVLLSENGDSAFQKKFFRNSIEKARQFAKAASASRDDEKMAGYASVFWAGGMLALVQNWLQNGMDIPAPELAKMISRLMREDMGATVSSRHRRW
jgi:AcrR family transcriptional regulator